MPPLSVATFYRFVALPDFASLQDPLLELCKAQGLSGSLLLASEGINGTLAGTRQGLAALAEYFDADPRLAQMDFKLSSSPEPPFGRMKVRLKREIVSMGVPGVDPCRGVGTYVEAEDWNRLIEDPEVIVVDVRNEMEVAIGSFRGARNPKLSSFREFPAWLRDQFSVQEQPKLAMFCTGGIRCEKTTAFLKQEGFRDVYHLKGGILKYLEQVPEEESLWEGECYVFDRRVALGHGLLQGSHEACQACGNPLSAAQRQEPGYVEGISCPRCAEQLSEEQKQRFAERMQQRALFEARKPLDPSTGSEPAPNPSHPKGGAST